MRLAERQAIERNAFALGRDYERLLEPKYNPDVMRFDRPDWMDPETWAGIKQQALIFIGAQQR